MFHGPDPSRFSPEAIKADAARSRERNRQVHEGKTLVDDVGFLVGAGFRLSRRATRRVFRVFRGGGERGVSR